MTLRNHIDEMDEAHVSIITRAFNEVFFAMGDVTHTAIYNFFSGMAHPDFMSGMARKMLELADYEYSIGATINLPDLTKAECADVFVCVDAHAQEKLGGAEWSLRDALDEWSWRNAEENSVWVN